MIATELADWRNKGARGGHAKEEHGQMSAQRCSLCDEYGSASSPASGVARVYFEDRVPTLTAYIPQRRDVFVSMVGAWCVC